MENHLQRIEFDNFVIYELNLSSIGEDFDTQVQLIKDLSEELSLEENDFGIIINFENVFANPTVRFHAKRLSQYVKKNKAKHIGSVLLNSSVFMRMLAQLIRKDVMFSDSWTSARSLLKEKHDKLKVKVIG